MASLGDFFGKGSIGEQLLVYNVIGELVTALASPGFRELSQVVNEVAPNDVLSPADAAAAVVRNFISRGDGAGIAAKSAVDGGDFDVLVNLAGDAPAPEQLAAALRRKVIPEGGTGADSISFTQGIAEGRLHDKWAPVIQALARVWPTPMDAIRGSVQGFYESGGAESAYEQFGGDPQFYALLHYINGDAPSPVELLTLWNRGIIPEDSGSPTTPGYAQGIRQGNLRDMWLESFKALREYLPPPRTVTAMYKEGALTEQEAASLLVRHGLPQNLVAAYLTSGTSTATARAKNLAEAEIVKLYEARIVNESTAVELLRGIHYSQLDAEYIVKLADMRVAISSVTAVVNRTRALYASRKITEATARAELAALQIPAAQIAAIMTDWDMLKTVQVKQLTEAQVVAAWDYGLMTEAEAIHELQEIGYTARDAWLLLSIKNKGAVDKHEPGTEPTPGVLP